MPSSHLILCRPLLLLPLIPPSIRIFSNESTLRMRWLKYWSFSFTISPSKEYPGLISFRMDWLDLLGVQGTLKSLLQHHSSKASILRRLAFFTVQLSHLYMTTGKTIALTRRTFVGKVRSLLFNILSRLVVTFLPRSKCLNFMAQSCPTLCNPMDYNPPGSSAHGILQARINKVGCHSLLQGIFPTQGWNLSLLHCRQILYYLRHQGSPWEGTKDPWLCLITTLLLLSLLWLFSFVSAFLTSLIKLILWLMFSTDKRQAEDMVWGQGP